MIYDEDRLETETEALERINQPFKDLEKYTHAIVQQYIRGLLVVGDPGLGKSFGVESVIAMYKAANPDETVQRFEVVKGAISSPVIYQKLYKFRKRGMVIVFDDCEIQDVDGLNLLKAALDSCDKRMISWEKQSPFLRTEGLPNTFEFKGGIIQLTNDDLMATKGKKKAHMEALVSRCHYIDMRLNNVRDKILRIKYVVYQSGMLKSYNFTDKQIDEIVSFIECNAEKMRELSLRLIKKVADLYIAFPDDWRTLAYRGCMVEPDK